MWLYTSLYLWKNIASVDAVPFLTINEINNIQDTIGCRLKLQYFRPFP